tara:strand:+ start:2019 stop:3593 length:1575 start_codon:yes stop_codon:yes gene_type:complete
MSEFDVVIIGSGINSLVAGALLSRKGHKVCILERNDYIGGCIKTDEITLPGFHHDVFSGWHPLFVTSPAYAELGEELHALGLEYVSTSKPTGVVLPDGRNFILRNSRAENLDALQRFGEGEVRAYERAMADIEQNAELIFGLLGADVRTFPTLKLMVRSLWKRGFQSLWDFAGLSMESCRKWLDNNFDSDEVKACFAPWILHTGLGPEDTLSGLMGKLIAFSLEQASMPIVKGGSKNLVSAFVRLIEKHGGILQTRRHVDQVLIRDGRAVGVKTADGDIYSARKAVIGNVTPTQLYGSLLKEAAVPDTIQQQSRDYQYGAGCMQIHLALDAPPEWQDSALNDVAMIHLTPGLDGVSKAVNEARRGLLPETATVVVGQPTALDPSRAPAGKAILWLQLQELPYKVKGDAAGRIAVPEGGQWTAELKEAYADRIIDRIAVHVPNLKEKILHRTVLSPRDLEQQNINLVQGDPYSGACSIDQFMMWRPLKSTPNHRTPVANLYQIGASTHPGPGLAGTSGYIVSQYL